MFASAERAVLVTLLALVMTGAAAAQDTGQIFGRVTDGTDAVLPGVTVTVSSPVLLQPRVAVTSVTGTYQVPGLPVGTYSVRFEIVGFRPVVAEQVRIEIGFSAQINATLEISNLQEDVVVVGVSPVVDLKSTAKGALFNTETLDAIPVVRDVYAVFGQVPGAAISKQNVGGNGSGNTTVMIARGAPTSQQKTFIDGVDFSSTAGTPFYLDFDSIQEMQITLSGMDASMQHSGNTINIVTKSGSDLFRGSARTFVADQMFQAENVTDELRRQGASAGSPLLNMKDAGAELGGPILRGRAWFWGAYAWQEVSTGVIAFYRKTAECAPVAANELQYSIKQVRECLNPNTATLKHLNYNAKLQVNQANRFSVRNSYDLKIETVRGANDITPFEATTRLDPPPSRFGPRFWTSGWPPSWKFNDQHVFSDRLLLDIGYGRGCPCTAIGPQSEDLDSVQQAWDVGNGARARSTGRTNSIRIRNTYNATLDYFRPGMLGGDHSFKVGVVYLRNWTYNESLTSANVIAKFNTPRTLPSFSVPFTAQLFRDAIAKRWLLQHSAFVQDSYTRNRLTVGIGVRWDRQDDRSDPISVSASPFFGQPTADGTPFRFLPAVDFPGAEAPVIWNTFAPRLGVTFDLTGSGKNVLKASYGLYFDQRDVAEISGVTNPIALANSVSNLTAAFIELPWNDSNGDKFVQANEINQNVIRSFGGGYNPDDPGRTVSPNLIDPGVSAPRTDEFSFGFSKELAANVELSTTYTRRKYTNMIWQTPIGLSSASYQPVTLTPPATACPASARCETVTYFVPNIPVPGEVLYTNQPDFNRTYQGFEVLLRKRMTDRWMLTASLSLDDSPEFFPTAASYLDPTNVKDGSQYAPGGTNARWMARGNGLYLLPWFDIGLGAVLDVRQGYPFVQTINVPSRPNRAGAIQVQLDPVGEVRLPTFWIMDFRIDRPFRVGAFTLKPTVDIFNLFNANTVLARRGVQNASNANQVTLILGPRVVRFGMGVSF
ncbi:MAG: TonB-dependent receptor [Acidimicrobiia bacterium]|nr:TonB-dependent receptor [Acidimicrobiia bacterium]